jgi:hypothetical protein
MTGKPLPYIELAGAVDPADVFPDPSELWAWAHVHANVDLSGGAGTIDSALDALRHTLASNPDLAYSRILSPRRLEPDTGYHAFLIPSFETGRLAGLGQPVPETTVATLSAWENHQNQFPVYHRWFFKTGSFGDFEYLVRLLVPRPVDKRVGFRDVDVLHPGSGLPAIDTPAELGGVLKLGGALRAPLETMSPPDRAEVQKYDDWDLPFPHAFESGVAALINLADDYARAAASAANPDGDPDPVVTLPLYGRWPAITDRVLFDAAGAPLPNNQNWIHRLNLDPRFRVAAGFGTEVIQENDQKYMSAAWQQVGDVITANTRLRLAELAHAQTLALHAKHVATLEPARQFVLTAPVHARVMGSPTSVAEQVRRSVVPAAVTSGVFRRLTRNGTALAKRLELAPGAAARIVTGINAGVLAPAPPKLAPSGAIQVKDGVAALGLAGVPGWLLELLARAPWLRWLVPLLILLIALLASVLGGVSWAIFAASAALAAWSFVLLSRAAAAARAQQTIREEAQTPESVDDLPTVANFVITRPGSDFTPAAGSADSVEAQRFKAALRDADQFTSIPFAVPAKASLDLATLSAKVVTAIHPSVAIPKRLKQIVYLPGRLADAMVEQFTPCMAYPVFDVPMYKPLSDLSAELFLPNIDLIPNNSITLLEPNQRFIEAYMVGLNHEMARELLWNEYPTDQRGSYFRQFWDVNMMLPPNPSPAQREAVRDIVELHHWPRASKLGTHDPRQQSGNTSRLVLVIRGELLKRYPTAVIYAQKAAWPADPSAERSLVELALGEEQDPPKSKIRLPLFEAKVDPDIYFLGFDLGSKAARGGEAAPADAGWFFVIKERPGEPRFGLDDVSDGEAARLINWNDLSWGDVGTAPGRVIRLNKTLSFDNYDPLLDQENKPHPEDAQARWRPSTNAAELAYILYQVPVLMAVHASRMLP